MQNKPNLPDAQMNVSSFYTVDYENKSNWKLGENKANTNPIKPNKTQNKPNTNPISSPIQAQTNPIKANLIRLLPAYSGPADLSAIALAKADSKGVPCCPAGFYQFCWMSCQLTGCISISSSSAFVMRQLLSGSFCRSTFNFVSMMGL